VIELSQVVSALTALTDKVDDLIRRQEKVEQRLGIIERNQSALFRELEQTRKMIN
jgi:hypothetical protein